MLRLLRRGRRDQGALPPPRRTSADGEPLPDPALPPEILAQVRRLEIHARRTAGSLIGGNYRSAFRGSGIEFAEAREYMGGDDVRRIDWNVTARMGTPWVKEYVEERELTVVCAVDVSPSQTIARPATGRMQAAAQVTALLTFTAAYNNDRTGLLTFSDRIEHYVPPRRGPKHAMRLVREVLGHEPGAGTDIAGAAEYLGRVLGRRSVVFLVSDFFDEGYEQALRTLARRHEVIALSLVDPLDLALADAGLVAVRGIEGGRTALLDSSDHRVRDAYARAAAERAERRRHALASSGVDEIEIRIDGDTSEPVVAYFRRRARRR